MNSQKWVNLGLLLTAFLLFLLLGKVFDFFWDLGRLPLLDEWIVHPVYLLSFGVSLGSTIWVRRSANINEFFNEVVVELSKITWPNRKETFMSAGVVSLLVMIASLALVTMDYLWSLVIRGILSL